MSLSDRNPYEVHAELVQRIERLEQAVVLLVEAHSEAVLLIAKALDQIREVEYEN